MTAGTGRRAPREGPDAREVREVREVRELRRLSLPACFARGARPVRGDVPAGAREAADEAALALLADVRGPLGWAVVVALAAVNLLLAVTTREMVTAFWPSALALALFVAALVPAVRCPGRWLPPTPARLVAVVPTVLALLVSWNLPTDRFPGYASWHLGAGAFLLFFLAVGHRLALAWAGFAGMAAVTVAWALSTGQDWRAAASLLLTHLVIIALGTAVSVGVRRNAAAVARLIARDESRAVARAAALARAAERERRQAELDRATRSVLERLAAGEVPSAAERAELAVLEADLRDRLRSAVLGTPVLARAVSAARRRGVRVQVLDDGGLAEAGADEVDRALAPVAAVLDGVAAGEVVVRVLPAGRDAAVTVVVEDGDDSRRTVVDHDGTVRTRVTDPRAPRPTR